MNSTMVQHVMIDGNWIVWNRQLMGIDEDAVMKKAESCQGCGENVNDFEIRCQLRIRIVRR